MDAVIVLLILLFVLLAIGVPVGFAIGGATMISMFFFSDLNMVVNAQYCYSGIFSFTVMAIPYFMLAGTIMSTGGIARRIVDFASALIDFVTGALGCVSMLACMFFGALTGSGMATTSAIGGMMIPEMKRKGYDSSYAATLVCFGGIVGPIIPPSLSFVLYGASTKTSVPDLFKAGIIPGVYSIIVSLFVYHDMTWKDLYKTFVSAAVLNGVTSFLLGTSTVFSTFMTFEQVPQMITNFMANLSDSPVVLLLVINVFLLIVGCFLDTVPAIIIIAPMLLPTIQAFNINPIHFGVVMSVNLAVGLCTPPYGCNLFVGTAVAKIKMESMLKWVVPFFLVSCVLLLILSFVPALSLAFV